MGEAAAVAQSLPKVVGNEVKTAGHPTILHLVRISIEDRADITETTTAHREVQPRTWVETCRVNSVSIFTFFLTASTLLNAQGPRKALLL